MIDIIVSTLPMGSRCARDGCPRSSVPPSSRSSTRRNRASPPPPADRTNPPRDRLIGSPTTACSGQIAEFRLAFPPHPWRRALQFLKILFLVPVGLSGCAVHDRELDVDPGSSARRPGRRHQPALPAAGHLPARPAADARLAGGAALAVAAAADTCERQLAEARALHAAIEPVTLPATIAELPSPPSRRRREPRCEQPRLCRDRHPDLARAKALATRVRHHVGGIKLGLEFFCAPWPVRQRARDGGAGLPSSSTSSSTTSPTPSPRR